MKAQCYPPKPLRAPLPSKTELVSCVDGSSCTPLSGMHPAAQLYLDGSGCTPLPGSGAGAPRAGGLAAAAVGALPALPAHISPSPRGPHSEGELYIKP